MSAEWRVEIRPVFARDFHEESRHESKEAAEAAASEWRVGGCMARVERVEDPDAKDKR